MNHPIFIRGLFIQIKGDCNVHWTEKCNGYKVSTKQIRDYDSSIAGTLISININAQILRHIWMYFVTTKSVYQAYKNFSLLRQNPVTTGTTSSVWAGLTSSWGILELWSLSSQGLMSSSSTTPSHARYPALLRDLMATSG